MNRFHLAVKLFAIENRRKGKPWGDIKRAIQREFLIEPPTIRAMQKWEKELTREGLISAIEKKTKEEAESVKKSVVKSMVGDLVPKLFEAKDAGEDIEYVSWKWFFSLVETTLGREKFRSILDRYLEEDKNKSS
jgi:hypothetical protein